jgi:hypothetical protein
MTDTYKKPELTYQEKLSKEQIKDMLEDYIKVNNISELKLIKLGTHLRYFTRDKNGKRQFRIGGILRNNSGIPDYLILGNGTKSWSVQINDTIFFQKISISDIKKHYIKLLEDKDKIIAKLNDIITKNKYKD